jgi:hypothetical protein
VQTAVCLLHLAAKQTAWRRQTCLFGLDTRSRIA